MNKTLDEYIEALRLHSNCDTVNCQSFNCGACKFALAIENVPTDREVLKYFEELKTLRVELEKNSKELEVYKKALEISCNIIENHAYCPYMCDGNRSCTDCILQKAREEE